MKRFSLFLAILITCSVYTIAQPPGGGRGGPGGPPPGQGGQGGAHGGPPPNAVLTAIDANGDHTISAREIANSATALKKLDKNRDGQLTSDEIHGSGHSGQAGGQAGRHGGPPGQGGQGGGGPQGQSGPPTAEQFMGHAMTFDTNKDGVLNKTEIQKMAAAVVQEMANRGGPGHGHEGGQQGSSYRQRPAIED